MIKEGDVVYTTREIVDERTLAIIAKKKQPFIVREYNDDWGGVFVNVPSRREKIMLHYGEYSLDPADSLMEATGRVGVIGPEVYDLNESRKRLKDLSLSMSLIDRNMGFGVSVWHIFDEATLRYDDEIITSVGTMIDYGFSLDYQTRIYWIGYNPEWEDRVEEYCRENDLYFLMVFSRRRDALIEAYRNRMSPAEAVEWLRELSLLDSSGKNNIA